MHSRLRLLVATVVTALGLAGCATPGAGTASDAATETSAVQTDTASPSPSPSPPSDEDASPVEAVDPAAVTRAQEALPDEVLPEGFGLVREDWNFGHDGVIHIYATDQYAEFTRDSNQPRGPEVAVRVVPGLPAGSPNEQALRYPEGAHDRPDIAPGAILYETPGDGGTGGLSLNIPVGDEEIIIASSTAGEDILIAFAEAVLP